MGWTPVNKMSMRRDFNTREIIIEWYNDVIGAQERHFTFEQMKEAFEFAEKEFNQLAM